MIIIVDAYNVLRQHIHTPLINEHERIAFVKRCGKYGKRKGNKMIVVFDGGHTEWPSQERAHGAYVVYSGAQRSADDYIKKYLKEHKSYDMLLVSSDNELADCASRLNIPSMRAGHFRTLLDQEMSKGKETPVKKQEMAKTTEKSVPELDVLMRKTKVESKVEDIVEDAKRKSLSRKPSKKERAIIKKIKKL